MGRIVWQELHPPSRDDDGESMNHEKRSSYQFKRKAGSAVFNANTAQGEAMRLALAKKAAAQKRGPATSWWAKHASPESNRADFEVDLKRRHAEIVMSAPDGSRSLTRVT